LSQHEPALESVYQAAAGKIGRKHKEEGMKKMKRVLAMVVAVALPATVLAGSGIREGLWEITSKMEMPGMPMEMPATTVRHCYTKEDVKDQKKVISRDKDCKVTDLKSSGSKVTWKMVCTGKNAGTFSGETVFSGDSYDSVMKMQSEGKGGSMTIKAKGKRVGNCP
jgi:hypothetical protein